MIRCRDRGGAIPHLRVHQPEKGYRFSIDSVLLADFAAPYCGRSALDLGTGSGVVLLLLACRNDVLRKGVGVEIQPQLWEFACRNIGENGFGGRLSAVLGDFRDDIPGLSPRSVDLVVSNPPYRKIGEGRRNPDPPTGLAVHKIVISGKCRYARAAGSPPAKYARPHRTAVDTPRPGASPGAAHRPSRCTASSGTDLCRPGPPVGKCSRPATARWPSARRNSPGILPGGVIPGTFRGHYYFE